MKEIAIVVFHLFELFSHVIIDFRWDVILPIKKYQIKNV